MTRTHQRIGCAGQDCPRASTCAAHTLASEMTSSKPRLCSSTDSGFAKYEPLPDQPVRVVLLQADWTAMPRSPLPPSSVFALGQTAKAVAA